MTPNERQALASMTQLLLDKEAECDALTARLVERDGDLVAKYAEITALQGEVDDLQANAGLAEDALAQATSDLARLRTRIGVLEQEAHGVDDESGNGHGVLQLPPDAVLSTASPFAARTSESPE